MEFSVERAKSLLEAVKNEEVRIKPTLPKTMPESDRGGTSLGKLTELRKAESEFDELEEIGESLACSVFKFEIGIDSGRSIDSAGFARKAEMWEAYAGKMKEDGKNGFGKATDGKESRYDAIMLGRIEGRAEAYRFLEAEAKKLEGGESAKRCEESRADAPND